MSFTKEKLLAIHSLALSGVIESMSDEQFSTYCKDLLSFTEAVLTQEKMLRSLYSANNYSVFSKELEVFRGMLAKVYAKGLELSCRRLLDELGSQKYSIVDAHLTYLLAEVSALSIDIQMSQYEDAAREAMLKAAANDADNARIKSILAVDDVAFLLFGLKSIMQSTKYRFTGVTSGESALRFLEKNTPDLFILDIEMPEMNGYELFIKLKERGYKAPVIFMTGNASVENVRRALELGASDFIVKPINEEHVLEKIRKHIGD